MRKLDKFLILRSGDNYYFQRKVPMKIRQLDGRNVILSSLKTQDLLLARKRRDRMVELTDNFWNNLLNSEEAIQLKSSFEIAMERAKLLGIEYLTAQQLVEDTSINKFVARVKELQASSIPENHLDSTAMLGMEERPNQIISKVLKIYFNKIALQDQENKTPDQVRVWKKAKTRAFNNFISLVGDINIDQLNRRHAISFFDWWMERVTGKNGLALSPGTAQKDIGNLKKIYSEYYTYFGDEDRPNPFRNLRFKNIDINKRPAFKIDEILKIYKSEVIQNLNFEARMLMFICADTGCRPSEICGLEKTNIHLDEEYPYIEIKDMPGRKLKTRSSNRKVPLIGVALEAMKLLPNGASSYKFRETKLSATVNKFLRANKLLPTLKHSFYSFRHSIMDRMEEANIEDEFRRRIMGHSIDKPRYGDGGNLKFNHDKFQQIELKFDKEIFTELT